MYLSSYRLVSAVLICCVVLFHQAYSIDPCLNKGCSHQCLVFRGSAYCRCPPGLSMTDPFSRKCGSLTTTVLPKITEYISDKLFVTPKYSVRGNTPLQQFTTATPHKKLTTSTQHKVTSTQKTKTNVSRKIAQSANDDYAKIMREYYKRVEEQKQKYQEQMRMYYERIRNASIARNLTEQKNVAQTPRKNVKKLEERLTNKHITKLPTHYHHHPTNKNHLAKKTTNIIYNEDTNVENDVNVRNEHRNSAPLAKSGRQFNQKISRYYHRPYHHRQVLSRSRTPVAAARPRSTTPSPDEEPCIGNHGCSHSCISVAGRGIRCECPSGFELQRDNKTCQDIDECAMGNGGCQQRCINTIGSHVCSCTSGFVTSPISRYVCIDVDECMVRNGGCSHKCVNTKGSHKCDCPINFVLTSNNKTCIDSTKPTKKPMVETYYPQRFTKSTTSRPHSVSTQVSTRTWFTRPTDLMLTTTTTSTPPIPQPPPPVLETPRPDTSSYLGCSPFPMVENAILTCNRPQVDGFFGPGTVCEIACHKGYLMRGHGVRRCSAGRWTGYLPMCYSKTCPALVPPVYGHVFPERCRLDNTIEVTEVCHFRCDPGYQLVGASQTRCSRQASWKKPVPRCEIVGTTAGFICPKNIRRVLPVGQRSMTVRVQAPRSNVNIENVRYVPHFVQEGSVVFPQGVTNITVHGIEASTGQRMSCRFSVEIVDIEAPKFHDCPGNVRVRSILLMNAPATWDEPLVTDNIAVAEVTKTHAPGSMFPLGMTTVTYKAYDTAGNFAQCQFQVFVAREKFGRSRKPHMPFATAKWKIGSYTKPCAEGEEMVPGARGHRYGGYRCKGRRRWRLSSMARGNAPTAILEEGDPSLASQEAHHPALVSPQFTLYHRFNN